MVMAECQECIWRVMEWLGVSRKVAEELVRIRNRDPESPGGMMHVSAAEVEKMRGKGGRR
jgi:hypothetical protein